MKMRGASKIFTWEDHLDISNAQPALRKDGNSWNQYLEPIDLVSDDKEQATEGLQEVFMRRSELGR